MPDSSGRRNMKNLEVLEISSLSRRLFLLMIRRFDVFLRPQSPVRAMAFSHRWQDQDQTLHGRKQHDWRQMPRIALSDFHFRQPSSGRIDPKFVDGQGLAVESRPRAENSRLVQVGTSRLSWVLPNREVVRIR